ncbi:MAG: hypothetical protein E5Y10_06605 [Mesorhizobium sp.]|nr:MAG: hypothetical protein EOS13_13025 [Mesorhizobium sp.]TIN28922.1 MAG: hypothetical protein E5Y19_03915 [Mesorhizobium sp.]TIN37993.1 MAG: hypothetical protein E5Y13_17910 [Mesorhizobium sp.]TJU86480.1 MAG: hypothetical protein E5Y15_10775 [Mesorhizobium sp.]TJU92217.1 MAG: hypothetical protein E5Y10_06605 [Mesorhizobium sp.]
MRLFRAPRNNCETWARDTPSVLPDISPSSGEIGSLPLSPTANAVRWRDGETAILTPVGGDVRQDREGAVPPTSAENTRLTTARQ